MVHLNFLLIYLIVPLTKAPAVGGGSSLSSESYDSNFGLFAFCWDRSDPAACSTISRNLLKKLRSNARKY